MCVGGGGGGADEGFFFLRLFLLLELPLSRCFPLLLLAGLLFFLLLHLQLLLSLVLEEGAHQSTHPGVEVCHSGPHLLPLANGHLQGSPLGWGAAWNGERGRGGLGEKEWMGGGRRKGRTEGRLRVNKVGKERGKKRGKRKRDMGGGRGGMEE